MSRIINSPGRYWVVRKPDSKGDVVAKFETTAENPSGIKHEIPNDCIAQSIPSRSALKRENPDTSLLTKYERKILRI